MAAEIKYIEKQPAEAAKGICVTAYNLPKQCCLSGISGGKEWIGKKG